MKQLHFLCKMKFCPFYFNSTVYFIEGVSVNMMLEYYACIMTELLFNVYKFFSFLTVQYSILLVAPVVSYVLWCLSASTRVDYSSLK